MDILDTIDAATGALCACGCGRPLPADGPSAWWATEKCQSDWQSGVDVAARRAARERARALVEMQIRAYALATQDAFAWFADNLAAVAPAMQQAFSTIARYWPEPEPESEPEPGDVMQRAIAAKRNRNTGPKGRPRAPRRIDATKAR